MSVNGGILAMLGGGDADEGKRRLAAARIATGAGLKAGGQIGGGIAAKSQSKTNAKLLETQGEQAFAARLREAKLREGTARANAAKGGGDPNVGSFADVIRQIAEEGRITALRERFAFQNEAQNQKQLGKSALIAGILGGASTLLGAANRFDSGPTSNEVKFTSQKQLPAIGGPRGGFGNIA